MDFSELLDFSTISVNYWISQIYFLWISSRFRGFLLDFSRPVRDFWVVAGPSPEQHHILVGGGTKPQYNSAAKNNESKAITIF